MQVRCIKAFGMAKVGEIVSGLPDGASVDPEHWEAIPADPPAARPAPSPLSGLTVTPKEGM